VKSNERDALLKLINDNPEMNLAQLAKAWNVPIDGDSMKFMSSVNIKVLVSALSQSTDKETSGLNFVLILLFSVRLFLLKSCLL